MESSKIKSASIWSIIETISASLLGILSILFLAKIVGPGEYGLIATAQFISGLLQIIFSLGLSELIIQKKNIETKHLQIFWSMTVILAIISLIICLIIGLIFVLNNENTISKILFFESFVSFFYILSIVPTAILMKNLKMKSFAVRNIFSRVIFFIFAIPLAFNGFGLWSVVYSNLIQIVVSFLLIFYETRNDFSRKINLDFYIIKKEMHFGYYVMIENLLWSFLTKILGLLIVIFHGTHALGLYNMSTKLTDTVMGILNTAITRLTLPVFSEKQEDEKKLLNIFQASTYYFNMLSMPAFLFLALTSNMWVPLILGEKWNGIVPLIYVLSIMNAIMNTRIFVGVAVKAVGRSKEFLKLSLFSATITLFCLTLTKNLTLLEALIILVFCRVVFTVPYGVYLLRKICNFSIFNQFNSILSPVVITICISVVLFIINSLFDFNVEYKFFASVFFCAFTYFIFCYILSKRNILMWSKL